jgi:hypothetical protein
MVALKVPYVSKIEQLSAGLAFGRGRVRLIASPMTEEWTGRALGAAS